MLAIVTVEKAAAAKIFFETHYNSVFSTSVTPRSMRRRDLEGELHREVKLNPIEREERRLNWARRESDHLREVRIMKSRVRGTKTSDKMASSYDVVKVLGKGSFGVVRLVREKVPLGYTIHIPALWAVTDCLQIRRLYREGKRSLCDESDQEN